MRLFISINFNRGTVQHIKEVQGRFRRLEGRNIRGKYSGSRNLHLTLAFLGEVPEEQLEDVKAAMESVNVPKLDLLFDDLGYFLMGKKQDEQLWWIGVHKNKQLEQLQSELIRELKEKGLRPDTKTFKPHITIVKKMQLRRWDKKDLFAKAFSTHAEHISLMLSEGQGDGLKYTEIYRR